MKSRPKEGPGAMTKMSHVPPSIVRNRGLIIALVAWSLAWKGLSLWHAAKDDSKPWFVTLLVSNTLGILDAIYIFGVSKGHR
jgi:hypothetical protein